jgi:hypothetical protein
MLGARQRALQRNSVRPSEAPQCGLPKRRRSHSAPVMPLTVLSLSGGCRPGRLSQRSGAPCAGRRAASWESWPPCYARPSLASSASGRGPRRRRGRGGTARRARAPCRAGAGRRSAGASGLHSRRFVGRGEGPARLPRPRARRARSRRRAAVPRAMPFSTSRRISATRTATTCSRKARASSGFAARWETSPCMTRPISVERRTFTARSTKAVSSARVSSRSGTDATCSTMSISTASASSSFERQRR